jgi:hypothetical protein
MQKELVTQRERLEGVETRTRRRWAPMPLDKYQKLAEDRGPRYEKRWQRFGKVYGSVHSYDRWDRGRYYDDFTWWDVMTRGRYDGSYLSDVAEYHRRHPGYQFDPDYRSLALAQAEQAELAREDAQAAAAAIAADEADRRGTNDASFVDGS